MNKLSSFLNGVKSFLPNSKHLVLMLLVFCLPISQGIAYEKFEPTELEYAAWSNECKAAHGASTAGNQQGLKGKIQIDENLKSIIAKIGYWHYCWGEARIVRGEMSIDTKTRERYFEKGIGGVNYSYTRIVKSHPWSAHIGTTLARGYKDIGDTNKAITTLNEVIKYHPDYADAYVMFGLVYYEKGDFISAENQFRLADHFTGGNSGKINYFLGLTMIKLDRIGDAKVFSEKALKQGYPMTGLEKLIAEKENKTKIN